MRGSSRRRPRRPGWRPQASELPWLALALLLALAVFLYALIHVLGDLIMKRLALLAALAAAAVALGGCTGLSGLAGGPSGLDFLKEVNAHLDGCDRTYQGTTTPVPQITIHVECKARAPAAPGVVLVPAEPEEPPAATTPAA